MDTGKEYWCNVTKNVPHFMSHARLIGHVGGRADYFVVKSNRAESSQNQLIGQFSIDDCPLRYSNSEMGNRHTNNNLGSVLF